MEGTLTPVQAHRRSSDLNLRVSTGGRNVHRGTGSTSTEVSVLLGSGVTYKIGAVLRRALQLRRSSTASRKLGSKIVVSERVQMLLYLSPRSVNDVRFSSIELDR